MGAERRGAGRAGGGSWGGGGGAVGGGGGGGGGAWAGAGGGGGGPVAEHPEHGEDLGEVLDLVEHHEAAEILQGQHRIPEPRPIPGVLEVEGPDRPLPARRELPGEGRLPHLPGPEDGHGGEEAEEAPEPREVEFPGDGAR